MRRCVSARRRLEAELREKAAQETERWLAAMAKKEAEGGRR